MKTVSANVDVHSPCEWKAEKVKIHKSTRLIISSFSTTQPLGVFGVFVIYTQFIIMNFRFNIRTFIVTNLLFIVLAKDRTLV